MDALLMAWIKLSDNFASGPLQRSVPNDELMRSRRFRHYHFLGLLMRRLIHFINRITVILCMVIHIHIHSKTTPDCENIHDPKPL